MWHVLGEAVGPCAPLQVGESSIGLTTHSIPTVYVQLGAAQARYGCYTTGSWNVTSCWLRDHMAWQTAA